ncbi:hypothetical protein ACLKA6_001097 [Drosophila palustris]
MNLMRSEENLPAAVLNADGPEGTCKSQCRKKLVRFPVNIIPDIKVRVDPMCMAKVLIKRKSRGSVRKPNRQPLFQVARGQEEGRSQGEQGRHGSDIIERKLSVMNPFNTQTQSSGVPPPDFPRSSSRTSSRSISNLSPEKVTQMIQNWGVKFDGAPIGQTVQEFLYRAKSLTEDCLQGDFSIICKNLHVLLVGKARDWYWRFRKDHSEFGWSEFCEAIRRHYQDNKDDDLILEEIR